MRGDRVACAGCGRGGVDTDCFGEVLVYCGCTRGAAAARDLILFQLLAGLPAAIVLCILLRELRA